jgi:hypothetical protein
MVSRALARQGQGVITARFRYIPHGLLRIPHYGRNFSYSHPLASQSIVTSLYRSQPVNQEIFNTSTRKDFSINHDDLSTLKECVSTNVDPGYLQSVGEAYVYMVQAKSMLLLNNRQDLHVSVKERVALLIAQSDGELKDEHNLFFYIGKLIATGDFDELQCLLPFTQRCHQFVHNFNSKIPEFYGDIVEEEFITNQPDSPLELPKFSSSIEFNPLFLADEGNFEKISKVAFDCSLPNELLSDLQTLHDFGFYSCQFYSKILDFKLSEKVIDLVVKNSLLFNSIKRKPLRELLLSRSGNEQFTNQVFYRYLALVTMNTNFPVDWLRSLQKADFYQDPLDEIPTNILSINKTVSFPKLEAESGSDVDDIALKRLGDDTLTYCITKLIIYHNDDLSKVEEYKMDILNIIEKSNPSDSLLLLGTLARRDLTKFESLVETFFRDGKAKYTTATVNYIKSLILKFDIPLPTLSITGNKSKFTAPDLINNNLNRFFLINCVFTKPRGKVSKANWKYNPEIFQILRNHRKLGDLRYKFLVNYFLKLAKLDDSSIPKFLNSNLFKRYVIDETRFYENQTEFIPDILDNSFSVVSSNQFDQFVASLTDDQAKDWVKSLVDTSAFVSHNYFESEQQFCKLSNRELSTYKPALNTIRQSRIVERMKGFSNTIMTAIDKEYVGTLRKEYDVEMGKQYVKFVVMKFNIEGNLDTFMNANREMIETFDLLFPERFYRLISINHLNGVDCETILFEILGNMNKFQKQFVMKDTLKLTLDLNVKPKPSSIIRNAVLPKPVENDLTKLLFIHQSHSMSFLKNVEKSNLTRLLNKIIQFSELGLQYHKCMVLRQLATANTTIALESLHQLYQIFMDKKLRILVNESTAFIMRPFAEKRANDVCRMLAEKMSRTSYLRMRFHSQLYNQYIGNLSFQQPEVADKWMQNFMGPILQEASKFSPSAQMTMLQKLQNDIDKI